MREALMLDVLVLVELTLILCALILNWDATNWATDKDGAYERTVCLWKLPCP